MDIVNLIVSLISGAIGGNIAGSAVSDKNLGTPANTILGLFGGGVGEFILKAFGLLATTTASHAVGGTTGHELDLGSILANIGVSGISGAALTGIVALIKDAIQKK